MSTQSALALSPPLASMQKGSTVSLRFFTLSAVAITISATVGLWTGAMLGSRTEQPGVTEPPMAVVATTSAPTSGPALP